MILFTPYLCRRKRINNKRSDNIGAYIDVIDNRRAMRIVPCLLYVTI